MPLEKRRLKAFMSTAIWIARAAALQAVALLTRRDMPPTQRGLEHDPLESLPCAWIAGRKAAFFRDKRGAFARKIMRTQK
jgi:hypothetical protein